MAELREGVVDADAAAVERPPSGMVARPNATLAGSGLAQSEERPVLVVDLGGQYSQLIARRVREARVYSELVGHRLSAKEVARRNPAAILLSGGPASVYSEGAPDVDPAIFELGIPTLGICYGMQLMARDLGGAVERTDASEFGKAELAAEESHLFHDLPPEQVVWMSHRDSVTAPPTGASVTASSPSTPIPGFAPPVKALCVVRDDLIIQ